MEIELTQASQERLRVLMTEKVLIEQRINDIIYTICDYNAVDINSNITLDKEITKLIING